MNIRNFTIIIPCVLFSDVKECINKIRKIYKKIKIIVCLNDSNFSSIKDNTIPDFLRSGIQVNKKTLTTEVVVTDPVYMAVSVGAVSTSETPVTGIKDNTKLRLTRDAASGVSLEGIRNSAYTIIKDYIDSLTLGSTIDITSLTNDLLSIGGVTKIQTVRTDSTLEVDGLSLLLWNPVYPKQDVSVVGSSRILHSYQYPYLDDPATFLDKIEATAEVSSTGMSEY